MAFGRVCELSVGENGFGTLISGLDLEFEVSRSLTVNENTATFTIYNAKEETRKNVLRKGNNLIFKLGYEDEIVNTVFTGNIKEASTVSSQIDHITKIFAVTAMGTNESVFKKFVSLSYAAGSNLQAVISQLGSLYGMVVYGLENANIILTNGFVSVGTLGKAFRYVEKILKTFDKGIYRDNDEIVVYNIGRNSKINLVTLSLSGGLKSLKTLSDKKNTNNTKTKKNPKPTRTGYVFESLIISQCQVNGLVNIQHPQVKGYFTVEKLQFKGNNFGGDFTMTGEVYA